MASQNLVSAALSPETKSEISARIAEIKSRLTFLVSLKGPEIMSLVKVGNGFAPFLDKAYGVASAHPEILPGVFNVNEFKKDYQLSRDLASIFDQVNELAESLNNTLTAVNSDAMVAALDVYSAVRQNADRVPGLTVAHAEMREFFKKTKPKTTITA
jgi:hypothetical protein